MSNTCCRSLALSLAWMWWRSSWLQESMSPLTPRFCLLPLFLITVNNSVVFHHNLSGFLLFLREKLDCTWKELQELANSYIQEPREYAWDWILSIADQYAQIIDLNKWKFINMGAFFHNLKLLQGPGQQGCSCPEVSRSAVCPRASRPYRQSTSEFLWGLNPGFQSCLHHHDWSSRGLTG